MKRIISIVSVLLIIAVIAAGLILESKLKNHSFVLICIVFLLLFLSYFYFENSSMGTKEIAVIATLSAFAGAARIPFAAIPNVQPTTFIVALSGYVFGPYEGFIIGATTAFISNIFLGQGPWTPWQMFAWGIVGAISGFIGTYTDKRGKVISAESFAIICFIYGFVFDWIMNLWHVIGFVKPLNFKTILAAYITGLTFDIMHAVGNFLFAIIFFNKLHKVLHRFKRKLQFTYLKHD